MSDENDHKESRWEAVMRSFRESWASIRDQVKARWDKLSEEDIEEIEGELGKLSDKIAERYGIARDEAERQVGDWIGSGTAWVKQVRKTPSLRWTANFLIVALAAALVGFTPITDWTQWLARVVFYISAAGTIIFFVLYLILHARR